MLTYFFKDILELSLFQFDFYTLSPPSTGLEPDMFLHVVRCVGPENLPPEERKEVKDVVAVPKPPAL